VRLRGVRLRGANLSEADLTKANFSGAYLYGANHSVAGGLRSGNRRSDLRVGLTAGSTCEEASGRPTDERVRRSSSRSRRS
jgi:hypothetical protein